MLNLKTAFSYSIAAEIMPDISYFKKKAIPTKFALILKTGESLSIPEIYDIKTRTGLSPLFLDIFENSNSELLRSYARSLGASVVKAKNQSKFASGIKECSFSISEDFAGALLSFLSHTPTYAYAGCTENRILIGQMCKLDMPPGAIMPYTKNRTAIISRPISEYEDFSAAIKKIRANIGNALCGEFEKRY